MATKTLDSYVARFVRREMADRQQTAQAVADILDIGIETARRKIRGAQRYELDEVATLSKAYGISLFTLADEARAAEEAVETE